jgi:hypothetical protein
MTRFLLALIALAALTPMEQCLAQGGPPEWMHVRYVQVRPDMLQEWEDIQKNEVNPAIRKAGVPFRSVWQTAVFGDAFSFILVEPIEKFARFDEASPVESGAGKEESARIAAKLRKCIVSSRGVAGRFRTDLSILKALQRPPGLGIAVDITVEPSKRDEFEQFFKNEALPAWRKTEIDGLQVLQPVFGGVTNRYSMVFLVGKFAYLDGGPPLLKALGAEGMKKLEDRAAALIESEEITMYFYRDDLSYQPAE